MRVDRLRGVAWAAMLACTALDLVLWPFATVDPLADDVTWRTARLVVVIAVIAGLLHVARPRIEPRITLPWLRAALRFAPEAFELLLFYRWIPVAITMADLLVMSWPMPLVDRWLAGPEQVLGLPHWRTYEAFRSAGLLPALAWIYGSIDLQLFAMLGFFALVKRDLGRLWEYTANVAVAGVGSIAALWALPAEGPWTWYHDRYAILPPLPAHLEVVHGLREGHLPDVGLAVGMLHFPSFHTVFALLIVWAMRGNGLLTAVFAGLNALVILATVPIGMHYLMDPAGGVLWTVAAVAVVRWWTGR